MMICGLISAKLESYYEVKIHDVRRLWHHRVMAT